MDRRQTYAVGGALAVALVSGLFWLNHTPAPPDAPPPRAASTQKGQTILAVPAAQARQLGIQVQAALSATEVPLADLPAMIAPPPGARVAVAASLPGVVMRTMVVEGDSVRRGQALAVISSPDVLSLSGDLTRAGARLGVAQSNAGRLSQLDREGIIAGARADEARALAMEARADVAEKSRILRLVNGHGGSGTYTLVAPIAGRVTGATIQAGSPVDGTTAPYVIDAVDRYEVEAQLPERLVGTIRPGLSIRLGALRGVVTAVGTTVDPATRSAMLKATLPPGSPVIAGRATSISVFGPAPAGAVDVPFSAVTKLDGQDIVFVSTASGFAPRKVVAGGSSGGMTLLLSGIRPGERVVTAGTSALKALAQAR
ncbi:efflux RND transporter periplasmic adaptor subunit [Sphingobium sp. AS12]|uniref:efflux RND transporter periplasmic adaptor subunit n=1 Tax=Sphingobium sp. AS12 TaxID=2849495 RepID=UPI001C31E9F3|nr:efflux RND transporter periplasmic adaptor subunit [Sphingobium sp. AS12]MBV2148154.1 efflux RND transporter periplasmic adaptor subunit [Sphingobium sp. AS12]